VIKSGIKIEEFISLYENGFNIAEISEKLNCSISNVSKRLKRAGIKVERRYGRIRHSRKGRYSINVNYFENIDSENKAYILGVLFADGSVSDDQFYLKMKDEDVLMHLKKELCAEQEIKHVFRNGFDHFLINLCSKKIVSDLIKIGCTINKTYTLKRMI
jgi:hypothetical protein